MGDVEIEVTPDKIRRFLRAFNENALLQGLTCLVEALESMPGYPDSIPRHIKTPLRDGRSILNMVNETTDSPIYKQEDQ